MTTTEGVTGNGVDMDVEDGGSRSPPNETREEKFLRLGMQRMNAVKDKARLIINLARYPHTEEHAARIKAEFQQIAADVDAAFSKKTKSKGFSF